MKSNKWFYFLILSIFLIITFQSFNCNSCFISNKKTIFVDGDNLSGIYDGTINHPFRTISDALSYANENDAIFIFSDAVCEGEPEPGGKFACTPDTTCDKIDCIYVIPEFSSWAIILIIVIVGIAMVAIMKKRK